MEPTTENPADLWKRFRTSQKSIEELAMEQGYKPPATPWPGIQGFMDDEEWEAFRSALESWRAEESDATHP